MLSLVLNYIDIKSWSETDLMCSGKVKSIVVGYKRTSFLHGYYNKSKLLITLISIVIGG